MWNKIPVAQGAKMPPRPQRAPQLNRYKRIKPLDQSKERIERISNRNSQSASKRSDSNHSKNSSEVDRSYSKRASIKSFSKVEDLSFKDEDLSPIRNKKQSDQGEQEVGEGKFQERGMRRDRQSVKNLQGEEVKTKNNYKEKEKEKNNVFSMLVEKISAQDSIDQTHQDSKQILELIQKHKTIITELQAQLNNSLLQTQKYQSLLLKTKHQLSSLRTTVSQTLSQFQTLLRDIPKIIVTISSSLQSFTTNQANLSYTSPLKQDNNRSLSSELCVRCQRVRSKEKSPSQLMENILRTISEVRMEIVDRKQGSVKKELEFDRQMWMRETRE